MAQSPGTRPDDEHDDLVTDALVHLEKRFDHFRPIAQRAALESSDAILGSELITVRGRGWKGSFTCSFSCKHCTA